MFTIYIVYMCLTHGLFTVCVSVTPGLSQSSPGSKKVPKKKWLI
jgi:hypothetical protein